MYNEDYLRENISIPIEVLEEIDSTNEEAKRRIKKGSDSDFVLVAKEQTAGKGRKGRNFYSPKDTGIYMTLVHYTDEQPENTLITTVATGEIARRAIEEVYGVSCLIKWVNDLYLNDRKVSGTLCELILKNTYDNFQNAIIIGIGINVSTELFPDDIKDKADSLINLSKNINNENPALSNKSTGLDEIVIKIVNGLQTFFKGGNIQELMIDYRKNSYVIGKSVELSDASGVFMKGKVLGVNDSGELIVLNENSEPVTISSGEISLIISK